MLLIHFWPMLPFYTPWKQSRCISERITLSVSGYKVTNHVRSALNFGTSYFLVRYQIYHTFQRSIEHWWHLSKSIILEIYVSISVVVIAWLEMISSLIGMVTINGKHLQNSARQCVKEGALYRQTKSNIIFNNTWRYEKGTKSRKKTL